MEDKTAEMINGVHLLADRETCQSKCNATILRSGKPMYWGHTYSVHTINVIVGNEQQTTNNICSSYSTASHLRINCSSWKHGKNVKQVIRNSLKQNFLYSVSHLRWN